MGATENTSMEQRIIQAAKQVFIEKGYAKAGMSDIAVRVGINRSGLHYYFRTKEKMFEAVFADIVLSFIPSIHFAGQADSGAHCGDGRCLFRGAQERALFSGIHHPGDTTGCHPSVQHHKQSGNRTIRLPHQRGTAYGDEERHDKEYSH